MRLARALPCRPAGRFLGITALLVFGFAATASAHAVLQAATPAHGTVAKASPDRLELEFNEAIDPRISTVVLVRDGTRIPVQPVSAEGRKVSYKVPALEDGLYIVDWRVISAIDGHLTRGSFAFGVGAVTAPIGAATTTAAPAWSDVVVRWLGLVGVLLMTGGIVAFLRLPIPDPLRDELRARLYQVAVLSTVMIIVSGVYRLASDATAIAGTSSLLGALGEPMLRVLSVSHTGHDLIFRLVAAVFLLAQLKPGRPVERDGLLAILGVMLVGPVLTTHGLTAGLVGSLVSLAHIISASVWVGGLAFFGALYLPLMQSQASDAVYPAAFRFSRLALISVIVLVITGLAQAYLYLGSPAALTGPVYGRMLLVKLIILTPLLLTAAVNRWRIVPRLPRMMWLGRPLILLVRIETALALTVVLVAAAVAISQPAKGAESPAAVSGAAPPPEESKLIMGGTVGDLNVTITVAPAKQGANKAELTATTGLDKKPLVGVVRFMLKLASLTSDLPPQVTRLDGQDGKAAGAGPFIGAPGWWELEVTVRRRGTEDVSLTLPLLIGRPELGANDPQAQALLKKAEALVAGIRSWKEREHYSSGDGYTITRQYVFAPPDRLVYRTNLGTEGRMLGVKSYFREKGSTWNLTEKPEPVEVRFRFPLATDIVGARLGITAEQDGSKTQIVTYSDPGGRLHFAVWIDLASGYPTQLFMVGEAHHMVTHFFEYNEKVTISAP